MKQKVIKKSFITLGLLLLFILLTLTTPVGSTQTYASTTDKTNEYRLNLKSITMVKGKSFTLKAYNRSSSLGEDDRISFRSDTSEVASVSDDGVISANRVGVATITVTIKNKLDQVNLTCDITVGPAAFSIRTAKSLMVLGVHNSDTLRVILRPSNTAETARFSSKDEDIATISSGGRITARKAGLTYLFGEIDANNTDGNRKFSRCILVVTSTHDVSDIENYFSNHPELNLINEDDLAAVLDDFFNRKDEAARSYISSESSLVDALNLYLQSKFDLAALKERLN